MTLISINVGMPRGIMHKGKRIRTGIFKDSVGGPVMLRELGAEGDGQADLSVHGGRDKAIYAYPHEHYSFWRTELARDDFSWGQFGENLTTEGYVEADLKVGDVFRIGDAEVEVSQPRSPCLNLAIRMEMADFPKRFVTSGRSGFYLRVLREGMVTAGDKIERIRRSGDSHGGDSPTLSELLAADYQPADNVETLKRAIQLDALSQAWRNDLAQRLGDVDGRNGVGGRVS